MEHRTPAASWHSPGGSSRRGTCPSALRKSCANMGERFGNKEEDPRAGELTRLMLELTVENRIATVRLNRPEVHNAFNEAIIEEMTAAFTRLGEQDDVRVIVLAAVGKSF